MTDRFEVPKDLILRNLHGLDAIPVLAVPALVRAEVERFCKEPFLVGGGRAQLDAYLDARYGPAVEGDQ